MSGFVRQYRFLTNDELFDFFKSRNGKSKDLIKLKQFNNILKKKYTFNKNMYKYMESERKKLVHDKLPSSIRRLKEQLLDEYFMASRQYMY